MSIQDPKAICKDRRYIHPEVEKRSAMAERICHAAGLMVHTYETYRSWLRSDYLYQLGRSLPGKIVTNAGGGYSWHNYGVAIDEVWDGDTQRDGIQWSWGGAYNLIGPVFEAFGFEWGGRWKKVGDAAHFQLTCDMDVPEAKKLYESVGEGPERYYAVWEALDKLYVNLKPMDQCIEDAIKWLESKGKKVDMTILNLDNKPKVIVQTIEKTVEKIVDRPVVDTSALRAEFEKGFNEGFAKGSNIESATAIMNLQDFYRRGTKDGYNKATEEAKAQLPAPILTNTDKKSIFNAIAEFLKKVFKKKQ